jgi:radial spoke head protein 4A
MPGDVRASRMIKVLFTGNLEWDIITNPYFFGKEKHYLRAQIARIQHGTSVIPKGMYKLGEAAEEGGP